jgi:ATP-dependent DNA ligase
MRAVNLMVEEDLLPMEARLVAELPSGAGWQFEPKWDGFRCLVYKNGAEVKLQAKSGKSLGRYFPEIITAIASAPIKRFTIDGELIIEIDGESSFEALQMRLHPAASRIAKLARETPAMLMAFDCLRDKSGWPIVDAALTKRRQALEDVVSGFSGKQRTELTRYTTDRRLALRWLNGGLPGIDGVIAKRLDSPYVSAERAMLKVKRIRTADCVVGGFRYGAAGKVVASLLLGLFDEAGKLHHVGFTSAISGAEKSKLTEVLEKLIAPPGFTGDAPGAPSRWSNARSAEWQPLKPKLVAEVAYDHVTGHRFRHGTRFIRWRPDKSARQCTFEQIASK